MILAHPHQHHLAHQQHRDRISSRRGFLLTIAAGTLALASAMASPAIARSEQAEKGTAKDAAKDSPANAPLRVVALGDSLTAGYQLPAPQAFPAVLEKALVADGLSVTIANAGVSGDTTSGGLARLDWSVPEGTEAVILELGANDMLRGVDPAVTYDALDRIIARLRGRGIPVLLAGMRAAPNLGPDYAARFEEIFPTLARKHDLVLYPFFLDGISGNPSLLLPDGLHPNAQGVEGIVERILPTVKRFLSSLPTRP